MKGAWADLFVDENNRSQSRFLAIVRRKIWTHNSSVDKEENVAMCINHEGGKSPNPIRSEEKVDQGVECSAENVVATWTLMSPPM